MLAKSNETVNLNVRAGKVLHQHAYHLAGPSAQVPHNNSGDKLNGKADHYQMHPAGDGMPATDMVLEPGWMCVISNPNRCPHRASCAEPYVLARISEVFVREGELLVLVSCLSEDDTSLHALPVCDILTTCPTPIEIPTTEAEMSVGCRTHQGRRWAHVVPGDRWQPPSPPLLATSGSQPLGATGQRSRGNQLSEYADILLMVASKDGLEQRQRQSKVRRR
uniref:Uncharacterized protein n=1 Tax=Eutreptiella gymnastica TaxID=73025 RepID=A0A7S1IHN6_9EUGL